MRILPALQKQQHGAVLILLVIALGVLAAAVFVGMLSSSDIQNQRDKTTAAALAEAKAAIIGWSVSRYSTSASYTPGQLPCPEDLSFIGTANEGTAKNSCTLPATGRLPWKTLKTGDIRDGYGEKLWYAISPGFRTSPINSTTLAQLTLDGVPNSAVAIILSAGPPLVGQGRPVPTALIPPVTSQYLDGSNNDGDNKFVTQGNAAIFNDKLLSITHHDLFSMVERRIASIIIGTGTAPSTGLRYYYGNNAAYPVGSVDYGSLGYDTNTKNMLTNNKWDYVVSYTAPNSAISAQLTMPKYCTASTTSGQAGVITCH
jgi:hypothetical protein